MKSEKDFDSHTQQAYTMEAQQLPELSTQKSSIIESLDASDVGAFPFLALPGAESLSRPIVFQYANTRIEIRNRVYHFAAVSDVEPLKFKLRQEDDDLFLENAPGSYAGPTRVCRQIREEYLPDLAGRQASPHFASISLFPACFKCQIVAEQSWNEALNQDPSMKQKRSAWNGKIFAFRWQQLLGDDAADWSSMLCDTPCKLAAVDYDFKELEPKLFLNEEVVGARVSGL
ncbi:hypothetical protein BU23DRAFT_568396 [Bimuria novae-zelandiae CBS 107.79]|uniref:Uncharacterized protein n=1 Tax=Bimuria novae-zelandiae CBS 107.79 TaxID=1447943 RepID=A0A6A5VAN9_9PLEO|nr:hypothetical protein BU23DRAFT_568396 [Bimuria novae-zelandiae CBS 107.79]